MVRIQIVRIMSDVLLDEYKAYYQVRVDRFRDNPKYKNTFAAETELNNAMQSCAELIEFKDKIGDKNEKCAVAVVQDKYLLFKDRYEKMQETVRLSCTNKILDKVVDCENVSEVITLVGDLEVKNGIEISMDEANRLFHDRWDQMDEIEIYENADVPSKYQDVMDRWASEARQSVLEAVVSEEKNNDAWESGWKLTPQVILEHRHRRLLPYSDEHVNEQLAKFRSLTNR